MPAETVTTGAPAKLTVYSVLRTILTSGITIGAVAGVIWGYGALCTRVEGACDRLDMHDAQIVRMEQLRERDAKEQESRFLELKTSMQEARTDLKWIKNQLKAAQ